MECKVNDEVGEQPENNDIKKDCEKKSKIN